LLRIGLGSSEDESTNKSLEKEKPKSEKLNPKSINYSNHPLMTDLDYRDKETKINHDVALWYERDAFKNLETEEDAEYELDKMIEVYKKKGGRIIGEEKKNEENNKKENARKRKISENDTDSDYNFEEVMVPKKKTKNVGGKDGFEVVAPEAGKKILTRIQVRKREREREKDFIKFIYYIKHSNRLLISNVNFKNIFI